MTTQVTERQILDALRCVADPLRGQDIISLGMVQGCQVKDGHVAMMLQVPADRGATRGALVGRPPGMLELVEIPPALRDRVEPGVALLSIGSRDVEGAAAAARAGGLPVHGPRDIVGVDGTTSTLATVEVGGVDFELIRYSQAGSGSGGAP